jgi:hypothetical protein
MPEVFFPPSVVDFSELCIFADLFNLLLTRTMVPKKPIGVILCLHRMITLVIAPACVVLKDEAYCPLRLGNGNQ